MFTKQTLLLYSPLFSLFLLSRPLAASQLSSENQERNFQIYLAQKKIQYGDDPNFGGYDAEADDDIDFEAEPSIDQAPKKILSLLHIAHPKKDPPKKKYYSTDEESSTSSSYSSTYDESSTTEDEEYNHDQKLSIHPQSITNTLERRGQNRVILQAKNLQRLKEQQQEQKLRLTQAHQKREQLQKELLENERLLARIQTIDLAIAHNKKVLQAYQIMKSSSYFDPKPFFPLMQPTRLLEKAVLNPKAKAQGRIDHEIYEVKTRQHRNQLWKKQIQKKLTTGLRRRKQRNMPTVELSSSSEPLTADMSSPSDGEYRIRIMQTDITTANKWFTSYKKIRKQKIIDAKKKKK